MVTSNKSISIISIAIEIAIGILPLIAIGRRSINQWKNKDILCFLIIKNYIKNNIIYHIQSCKISNDA